MARKVETILVDDIEGTEIQDGGGHTITFSVDGATYEIDLSDKNAKKMRETLKFYSDHGRRVSSRTSSSAPGRRPAASTSDHDRDRLKDVRDWGKGNGYKVSDRGRVSKELQEAYTAAH